MGLSPPQIIVFQLGPLQELGIVWLVLQIWCKWQIYKLKLVTIFRTTAICLAVMVVEWELLFNTGQDFEFMILRP